MLLKKAVGSGMKKFRQKQQLKRCYVAAQMGISEALYAKLEQADVHAKFVDVLSFCKTLNIAHTDFVEQLQLENPELFM